MKSSIPVLLVVCEKHKKAVLKNKDLLEIYKNYIENKYKKNFQVVTSKELNTLLKEFDEKIQSNSDKFFLQKHLKGVLNVIFTDEIFNYQVDKENEFYYIKEIIQD